VSSRIVVPRAVILMAALALNAREGAAQRVTMRVGYKLTFIGDKVAVDARVADNAGRPVTNASLAFRMADPAIASVSPRGEVVAKKPGSTRVWAVSGRDSAFSYIVVEQWASRFAFTPATVRLDAIGAKQPLKVVVSDAAGVPVAGSTTKTFPCRVVNDRIATLTSAGDVVAVGNGSTYVRCADKGIADSAKIDVQQRAITATILNKAGLRTKQFGDTFSVRISARDRQGKDVVDARPTWASLNPLAVSVDPFSGKARAVNGGDAKIIVQIGDIADSTTISVTGSAPFQAAKDTATVADTAASKSKASVSAQDIVMTELDTATVSVVATDSAGAQIQNPKFKFRVSDATIAKAIDSARVVAVKPGQARLIVEYGTHVDSSKTVFVNAKGAAGSVGSISGTDTSRFLLPGTTWLKDSMPAHVKARATVDTLIHTDPRTAAGQRNLVFSANGAGAIAEHLSHPSADVTEDRSGVLIGGTGAVTLRRILQLSGTFRTGTLSSTGTVGEPLTIKEGEGSLGVFLVKQLELRLGYILRDETTTLSTQSWKIPKVSLVTRFSFIGDAFNTLVALSMLPKATYSGAPTESPGLFSRAGEAGLEFHKSFGSSSAFNAGMTYYVEQFNFDNSVRVEEFSALRFRLGFQRGW
jgi:hypothetical protein